MRFALALLALSLMLCGCPSQDCAPHSQSCDHDTVRTCSSTGHGFAASGLPLVPCSAVGRRCVIEHGRGRCAPLDAGDLNDASDAAEVGP